MYKNYLNNFKDGMEGFELDLESEEFTRTAIYCAIKQKDPQAVQNAIYNGENVHLRDLEFGSTYLHMVVSTAEPLNEDKLVPVVYQLSNAGLDVNAKDYKARTALELCVYRELKEIMVALLRVGVEPTDKDYKSIIRDQHSPFEEELIDAFEKFEPGLWTSVVNNDTGMVHMLVNSWCRVNTYRQNKTLLQYAKESYKSVELISTLDDFEVTIEFVHATLAGDEKRMLEFLMDAKPCDPNMMDISFQERWGKPLHPRSLRDTAICMGHTHVLHLLPEADDEIDNATVPALLPESPTQERATYQFQGPHKTRYEYKNQQDVVPVSDTRRYSDQVYVERTTGKNRPIHSAISDQPTWSPELKETSFGYYYETKGPVSRRLTGKSDVSGHNYQKLKKAQKEKNKSKLCNIS